MARKRMIDPSIWTDEGMAELLPRQQLLYIGLFSNADDDGRLKCSPVAISLMLPTLYAGVSREEIDADLNAVCASMRQLTRYQVDSRPYLVFQNFRQWQRIDKPSPSILPAPSDADRMAANVRVPVASDTPPIDVDPGTFDEDSTNDPGGVPPKREEVKRTEEKGEGASQAPPPAPEDVPKPEKPARAARIPTGFIVSAELRAWAKEKFGFDDATIDYETEKFRDYYGAKPDTKLDWAMTWRNWIRKSHEMTPVPIRSGSSRNQPPANVRVHSPTDNVDWLGTYGRKDGTPA